MSDNEDIKFDRLLSDKRHKELKVALNNIAVSLSNNKNHEEVIATINNFSDAIAALSKKENNVNVETNQELVVKSLEEIGAKILERLIDLKSTLQANKKWEFKVIRNYNGYITSVEASNITNQINE